MRRSSTAWSAVFGYATTTLGIARNIVLVPLYLHYMSPAEYGAWLATGGTLVQLLVSDFGIGGVILQRTAAATGAGDREKLSVTVGTAWFTSLVVAGIVSAVCAAFSPFLPGLLSLDPSIAGRIIDCFILSIAANAVTIFSTVSGSVLRGLQRGASAGLIQFFAEVTVILVTVAMLHWGFGLYALAWGLVARALFSAFGSAFQTHRVCMRELRLNLRLRGAESRQLIVDSTHLFVVSLSMKLLTRSDVFFVGTMLGGAAAAVYGITTRIIDTIGILMSQLTSALLPAMAHLYGEGNLRRFRDMLMRITPVLCAVALVGLATAASVDEDFVLLWVGPGLFGGAASAFAFAAAAFVSFAGFIAYDVLMAAGRFHLIARTFAAFSLAQIPLTILMLQRFGMVGAPLAAIVSATGWSLILWGRVPVVLAWDAAYYRRLAGAMGISAAIVILVVSFCGWLLPRAQSWGHLAATGVAIGATMLAGILSVSPSIRMAAWNETVATLRALGRKS